MAYKIKKPKKKKYKVGYEFDVNPKKHEKEEEEYIVWGYKME
jgi:hypothetical protein